jgi:hypothetical protein
MRSSLYLPSIILATVLCFLPTYDASEAELSPATLSTENKSHIISVPDSGLTPSTLHMRKNDGLGFFLNDSSTWLVTNSVNYSEHATDCASVNVTNQDNGTIRSRELIDSKDLFGSWEHDSGSYAFTVQELRTGPADSEGDSIIK